MAACLSELIESWEMRLWLILSNNSLPYNFPVSQDEEMN
jgi:hypothetical protein